MVEERRSCLWWVEEEGVRVFEEGAGRGGEEGVRTEDWRGTNGNLWRHAPFGAGPGVP